jgi:hypothetical protein
MAVSRDTRTGPESAATRSGDSGAVAWTGRAPDSTGSSIGAGVGSAGRVVSAEGRVVAAAAALRIVPRGTQPARLIRVHVPLTRSFFSRAPVRTRASTLPLGDSRMFSPPGVVTTRSKPSRVVGSVDLVKIQPSITTSRHSPRLRLGSTGVPAGRDTSAIPCGSFRSLVATEISGTCCASARGANVRNAPTTQAGSQPRRGLDCGA